MDINVKWPLRDRKFLVLLGAVLAVIILEGFALSGIHIPGLFEPAVFLLFIIGIGYPVLRGGFRALLKLNFSSISLLMLIAVAGAYYLGQYAEAAVVIVLYVLGERLEEIGITNSKSALEKLVAQTPKTAWVTRLNAEVPLDNVAVGEIIEVKPHSLIPLDGIITQGDSLVDEATITGEPIPSDKRAGDQVYAGSMNQSGFLKIRSTKALADTTFSKIIRLTFEAQAVKSETHRFIQRFAKVYTPVMVGIAMLVFLIPVVLMQGEVNHWMTQAITLLVISCPCALVISTPVAVYSAIGNASSKGILVKGGKYLEAMAGIDTICFDKTRTITYGQPVVSDVIPVNNTDREELLACTAGAEIFSEHPLAQAIVHAAQDEGYVIHEVEKFRSIAGKGATAKCLVCEDETILVGKLDYIHEFEPYNEEVESIVENLSAEGKTSVVVSFGKGIAGVIGLTDKIRPESEAVIRDMKSLGLEPVMLTGDHKASADYVAHHVGIDLTYGALLPEDKSDWVKSRQQDGRLVAMVGDGVNDAPALAAANVGIAMGAAGNDVAIETANIALMNDKLSIIPQLIRLSRRTMKTIRFNIALAILVKVLFIGLAIAGYSHLVMAIAADVGVTLLVILISLHLMNYKTIPS